MTISGIFIRVYILIIFCCADIIAFILYLRLMVAPKTTRVILANIKTIFPTLSTSGQKQLIRKYKIEMCKVAASYLVLSLMPKQYLGNIVTYENLQLLKDLYKQEKNVALMFPHYGHWTYITTLPLFTDYKVFATIGMTSRSTFNKIRRKHGTTLLYQNKAYKTVLKSSENASSLYIIVADQLPLPPFKDQVTFFGRKVFIQTGAMRILKHTGGIAIYMDVRKISRYNYCYSFRLFDDGKDDYATLLQKFYTTLETNIKAKPELWYRWSTNKWAAGSEKR